jgi:hypothetical protein
MLAAERVKPQSTETAQVQTLFSVFCGQMLRDARFLPQLLLALLAVTAAVPDDATVTLVLHVKHCDARQALLEQMFWNVSTPGHPQLGRFPDRAVVAGLMAPCDDTIDGVIKVAYDVWLCGAVVACRRCRGVVCRSVGGEWCGMPTAAR